MPSSTTHRTCRLQRTWATGRRQGRAYRNFGCTYETQGDCSNAIKYQVLLLEISKEVCDRAGEGKEYANLCNEYHSQGDSVKVIECHTQCSAWQLC